VHPHVGVQRHARIRRPERERRRYVHLHACVVILNRASYLNPNRLVDDALSVHSHARVQASVVVSDLTVVEHALVLSHVRRKLRARRLEARRDVARYVQCARLKVSVRESGEGIHSPTSIEHWVACVPWPCTQCVHSCPTRIPCRRVPDRTQAACARRAWPSATRSAAGSRLGDCLRDELIFILSTC
jgi:hypothetical protein